MDKNNLFLLEQINKNTINLKKIYIDIAGDLITGILLSQIVFLNYDRSIKILEKEKLVDTVIKKFDGNPTKHIKLNTEILMDKINSELTKGELYV